MKLITILNHTMSAKKNIQSFTFIVLAFISISAFSQTKQIDSLKLALVYAKEDTNKVNLLNKLVQKFSDCNDAENSILYTDSLLRLAKKLKFVSGEIAAYMAHGYNFGFQKNNTA